MPVISLSNVHHAYGSHVVLDGVAASIEPGEKIGLIGRNGSGKTTLMRVMPLPVTPPVYGTTGPTRPRGLAGGPVPRGSQCNASRVSTSEFSVFDAGSSCKRGITQL